MRPWTCLVSPGTFCMSPAGVGLVQWNQLSTREMWAQIQALDFISCMVHTEVRVFSPRCSFDQVPALLRTLQWLVITFCIEARSSFWLAGAADSGPLLLLELLLIPFSPWHGWPLLYIFIHADIPSACETFRFSFTWSFLLFLPSCLGKCYCFSHEVALARSCAPSSWASNAPCTVLLHICIPL